MSCNWFSSITFLSRLISQSDMDICFLCSFQGTAFDVKSNRLIEQPSNSRKVLFCCLITVQAIFFKKIWQPPIFPDRCQPSIVGRLRLNHRVRDGNGCCPQANRHQKGLLLRTNREQPRFASVFTIMLTTLSSLIVQQQINHLLLLP